MLQRQQLWQRQWHHQPQLPVQGAAAPQRRPLLSTRCSSRSTGAQAASQRQQQPCRQHNGEACTTSNNAPFGRCHGAGLAGAAPAPARMHAHAARRRVVQPAAAAAADMGGDSYALPSLSSLKSKIKRKVTTKFDGELFELAIPALAAMVLDPLMNIIDAAMVGHLGAQQLGAVSLGSLSVSFSVFLFSFLMFLTTPRVAAAVVSGNRARISKQAAMGIWLAGGLGVVVSISMFIAAPTIVAALKPPDAMLAQYAVEFIKVRSFGILAIMLSFVAAGTYRGMKDTRTPLVAAACATTAKLLLNVLFIYGLQWGVKGSGLASSISNWITTTIMVGLLLKKGLLRTKELAVPPAFADVLPLLRAGVVLSARVVITFGCIMYGSALTVRTGAVNQSAFEILRQVWLVSMQVFECLNVATQSMAATLLGQGDTESARALLLRALSLSTAVGAAAGAAVWLARAPLVGLFSGDAAVAATALGALPLVCAMLPLDAAASIMDGGLMAASQTDALSIIQVAGSVVQYAGLCWLVANNAVSVLGVWAVLKLLSVFRFAGGSYVHFASPWSAYKLQPASASASLDESE